MEEEGAMTDTTGAMEEVVVVAVVAAAGERQLSCKLQGLLGSVHF